MCKITQTRFTLKLSSAPIRSVESLLIKILIYFCCLFFQISRYHSVAATQLSHNVIFAIVATGSVSAGDSGEWRRRGIPHEEDGLEDGGRSRKEPQRDCGANHHRLQG